MPEFKHAIINELYKIDCFIAPHILQQIVALGADVVPDLEKVLDDSIENHKRYEEDPPFAPVHALYLLAELRSEASFPTILRFFSQGDDFADFWLGDFLCEDMWEIICKCGNGHLQEIEEFLSDSKTGLFTRTAISTGLAQIGLHFPECREQILTIYRNLLRLHSEALTARRATAKGRMAGNSEDEEFLTFAVGDLVEMGAVELEQEIKRAFDNHLINEGIVGEFDDLDFSKVKKMQLLTIYEKYDEMQRSYAFAEYSPHNPNPKPEPEATPRPVAQDFRPEPVPDVKKLADTPPTPQRRSQAKIGRNDPCSCGSGRKFKNCCMGKA